MKVLLASAALAMLAVSSAGAQQAVRSGPAAPALAEGRAVYAHWCAPCHAANPGLAGTRSLQAKYEGRLPAALEDRTDMTAPVIRLFVRNGVAWMAPFRPTEISDAELAQLSAYLTAPLDQRGAHAPLIADEMAAHAGANP
jgi:mono/diheme cytochrome c family protein